MKEESHFQEGDEVLFMPGSAFAVEAIELNEKSQLYTIKLKLCDDDEIQKGFHKKNIFKGDRDTVRELFNHMGTSTLVHECSNLDQLYNHMIKLFSFDKLIEFDYLKAMGSIYFKNKNFQLSIHYFERCLALSQTIVHSEEKDIAELYCSIAESHYRLRNYNQTINFYHKALNLNSLPSSKVIMPHSYLGFSYLTRADWSNVDDISSAKYHLQQVLYIDLENEILGDGKIIDIYQALGDINEYQNDPNSALDYYTQALELCESNQWTDDSNEFKEKIQAIKSHITESEQCKT